MVDCASPLDKARVSEQAGKKVRTHRWQGNHQGLTSGLCCKFLTSSDQIRHRIRLKPEVETRSNHRIVSGNTVDVLFAVDLSNADSVGPLRIGYRAKE